MTHWETLIAKAPQEDHPLLGVFRMKSSECQFHLVQGQGAGVLWMGLPFEGVSQMLLYLTPEHRTPTDWQSLLALAEERARALQATAVLLEAPSGSWRYEGAIQQGFEEVGAYRSLRWAEVPEQALPEGFGLLPYSEVQDPEVLLEILKKGYSGQVGHHEPNARTVEDLLGMVPAEHIWFLQHQQEHVGICRIDWWDGHWVLDAPGIVPEHRTPELALAFVSRVVGHVKDIQMQSWGDPLETVLLYQQAGAVLLEQTPYLQKKLDSVDP